MTFRNFVAFVDYFVCSKIKRTQQTNKRTHYNTQHNRQTNPTHIWIVEHLKKSQNVGMRQFFHNGDLAFDVLEVGFTVREKMRIKSEENC